MAIQMILCVETKKSADTDSIYILDTINRWYKVDNKVKISKINMNSKSRYNSKDVVREIAKKKKEFVLGDTHVIYFIDTDQYDRNPEHERELKEITRYCEDNGINLVWFCHDVEEVFLEHKVSDSQKVQEATTFRRKRKIEGIQIEKLSCNTPRACVSNIMNILDKYLARK
jgi:hypothetical protein